MKVHCEAHTGIQTVRPITYRYTEDDTCIQTVRPNTCRYTVRIHMQVHCEADTGNQNVRPNILNAIENAPLSIYVFIYYAKKETLHGGSDGYNVTLEQYSERM